LNRLVGHVLDLTRARWNDQPQQRGVMIKLQTELAGDLPAIRGTENEIRDALTNLIFNAVDAMPEGGTLVVRTMAWIEPTGGRRVRLEVHDSGVGMDEETRSRCLEPFFSTKGERGSGLGLAMVYGMAQRHGAELQIDSSPGHGTCFALVFPALAPAAVSSTGSTAEARVVQPSRILVIDDDPVLLRSLTDVLESDRHSVTAADGGQAGIDAFLRAHQGSEPFAVVITDLGMPYVDGRRVAAAIKATSPTTPVILLTGWGRRMEAENDKPDHIDRLLSKPPKLSELRTALAALTATPQTESV